MLKLNMVHAVGGNSVMSVFRSLHSAAGVICAKHPYDSTQQLFK